MVWETSLPRPQKYVLLALADHADHEGGSIYPGLELIAWKTDYDERHIRRILNELVADKILVREYTSPGGNGANDRYRIDVERLPVRTPFRKRRNDKMSGVQKKTPDILNTEHRTFSTPDTGHFEHETAPTPIKENRHKEPSLEPSCSMAIDIAVPHRYDDRFESFWSHYPRKENKLNAEKAFLKLKPSDALLQVMIDAIDLQVAEEHFEKRKVTPHGASWINGERWDDEVLPAAAESATMQKDATARDRAIFEEAERLLNGSNGLTIETTGEVIYS